VAIPIAAAAPLDVAQCCRLNVVVALRATYPRIVDRYDDIPDVRDGLTREERIVLDVLYETQEELGGRNVPTAMLWGRVCEHFDISPEELTLMLSRLGAGQ
jgi:hypothetical protein